MRRLLASALLVTAFSCSGGGGGGGGNNTPTPAARLTYTDPSDTGQWRLTRNAASTTTHLVLDLMAPAGASGRGVSVVLTCDSRTAWRAVNGSAYVQNGAYTGDLVQKGSVSVPVGSDLRVLLSQKPGTSQAYGSSPVLSVALDLPSGTLPGTSTITAAQGAHLGSAAIPDSITVMVGTLKAE